MPTEANQSSVDNCDGGGGEHRYTGRVSQLLKMEMCVHHKSHFEQTVVMVVWCSTLNMSRRKWGISGDNWA